MYAIWRAVVDPVKGMIPYAIRKRKLNFIAIHYIYLTGMAILGSVIVYGTGGIAYIDALFFTCGAATQSGLNTVDVNKLNTAQQMVLYMLAMFCNPIFIHSFVVFIRLYWFEKRFQHIVRDAKNFRRTKSRSRTNTFNKDEAPDYNKEENGVRGRAIRVLHNTQRRLGRSGTRTQDISAPIQVHADQTSDSSDNLEKMEHKPTTQRRESDDPSRLPQQMDADQHIAFLENQRNPKDSTTLYIPSPREFDRGGAPEAIDDEHEAGIERQTTSPVEPPQFQNMDQAARASNDGEHIRSHLTFDEPNIIRSRNKTSTFPRSMSTRSRAEEANNDNTQNNLGGGNSNLRKRRGTFSSLVRASTDQTTMEKEQAPMPYLSYQPTIGRNSMFVNLTEDQREELGGIEYRSLKTLALILISYFFGLHLFGIICLVPWILHTSYGQVVTGDGQGRVWWGVFTAGSAFNDLGFTLTPDSMISFQRAVFPLLLMTFLIVFGNTGFPCMLRFVIWLTSKVVPVGSGIWEELRFLLDHPRRCFTLLFPRGATWWLFAILCILNGVDLIFFIILDLDDPTVTSLPPGLRVVDGLFQASSTRTAGFGVVNLADLHPAIQVSYLIMMYISVFPIAISMRRTNVYEEKSLGIYGNPDEETEEGVQEPSYVGAHLRRQLSFDLWYIFLGMFVIAIAEGGRLQSANDYAFNLFAVLFEIVSAYGTVGLSLGYPTVNASFSSQFNVVSKLVIIAMQIRGRHRGLPYQLDRAILLPSESLHAKEDAEAEKRSRRRGSNISTMSAVSGQQDPNRPFRPETGLNTSSNINNDNNNNPSSNGPAAHQWLALTPNARDRDRESRDTRDRDRRGTSSTNHSLHTVSTHQTSGSHTHGHSHGPTKALGNVMFNLATHPEVPVPGMHGGSTSASDGEEKKKD